MTEKKMNKAEFVNALAEKTGKSKAETERFVNAYQDLVIEEVASGVDIHLSNFLQFQKKPRSARVGRNPQTGKEIQIPAYDAVKVTALKRFRDTVKGD